MPTTVGPGFGEYVGRITRGSASLKGLTIKREPTDLWADSGVISATDAQRRPLANKTQRIKFRASLLHIPPTTRRR